MPCHQPSYLSSLPWRVWGKRVVCSVGVVFGTVSVFWLPLWVRFEWMTNLFCTGSGWVICAQGCLKGEEGGREGGWYSQALVYIITVEGFCFLQTVMENAIPRLWTEGVLFPCIVWRNREEIYHGLSMYSPRYISLSWVTLFDTYMFFMTYFRCVCTGSDLCAVIVCSYRDAFLSMYVFVHLCNLFVWSELIGWLTNV